MKYFYFACSKTENNKHYAWMLRVPESANIIGRIKPDTPDIVQPCPTKRDAERVVTYWNASYIANGTHLFETHETPPEPENTRPLRVCERCLMAIESREGAQITRKIYLDADDDAPCDWCECDGFDVLHEIL